MYILDDEVFPNEFTGRLIRRFYVRINKDHMQSALIDEDNELFEASAEEIINYLKKKLDK